MGMYQSKTHRQPANFISYFAYHSSLIVYRVLTKANRQLLITIALTQSTKHFTISQLHLCSVTKII